MNDHIVHANGVELCAEAFGAPGDPFILLIHGAGNSMLSWDAGFCERLAAGGRHVVRYDMRDAGRSVSYAAGSPEYELRDLVGDAVGFLDAFGADRGHIVGLSLGGAIGQLLGIEHGDRVASLTLASSTPGGPGHDQPDLPGISGELAAAFAAEPREPDWGDRAAVIDYLVEAERPFAGREFDEAAMRDRSARIVDRTTSVAANLTNVFRLQPGPPWRDRLGEIAAPTLVVHGTDDPMFPLPHAAALAAEIPGAELLALEDVGHEYFPPATWDTMVQAILRISAFAPPPRARGRAG